MGSVGMLLLRDDDSMHALERLRSAASLSVQTTSIALSSVNVAAAVATAATIVWDCRKTAKSRDLQSWRRVMGAASFFPLVLFLGIAAQGVLFIVVQALAFGEPLKPSCASISKTMLPAIFIVPYIQLVFGLEAVFQTLRSNSFGSRRLRWTTPICLVVVVAGLLATYAVTRAHRPLDTCVATLFWLVQTWGYGCLIVFLVITLLLLLCVALIVLQLYRVPAPTTTILVERVAAVHTVYYLCLGSVMNVLVIPFFVSVTFQRSLQLSEVQTQASIVAMVADNLTGIVFGLLYLYLRSALVARPKENRQRWAHSPISNPLISQPISPPFKSPECGGRLSVEERAWTGWGGMPLAMTMSTAQHQARMAGAEHLQRGPASVPLSQTHARKESYALFPFQSSNSCVQTDPLSVWPLPPKMHDPGFISHDGGSSSSLVSSATVQIGLRVSQADDAPTAQMASQQRTNLGNQESFPEHDKSRSSPPILPPLRFLDENDDAKLDGDHFTLTPAVYEPWGSAEQMDHSSEPLGVEGANADMTTWI